MTLRVLKLRRVPGLDEATVAAVLYPHHRPIPGGTKRAPAPLKTAGRRDTSVHRAHR